MVNRDPRQLAGSPDPFGPVARASMFERVVAQIMARLADGSLPPGARLAPERELARSFGVSRPTVRQALSALAHMGILETRLGRNGGTVVRGDASLSLARSFDLMLHLGEASASHLLEARLAVEVQTAALAALRRTDEQLRALREALDGMLRPDTAPEVFAFYGTRFHLGIAEASGNPILLTVMLVLTSRLARFVTETCTIPELRNSAAADHEPIFAAIVARQPVAARRAMRDHFRVLVERFHDDPASLRDGPPDEPGAPGAGGRAGPA